MIITKKKEFNTILSYLKDKGRIFLVGCGACAEQCMTGGEREVFEMAERLKMEGKKVRGFLVVDEACHSLLLKREFRKRASELKESDAILVLSCGVGVSVATEVMPEIPSYPALDSLFLAKVERHGHFQEGCSLCGDCILAFTGGICPITFCPKGILNGPCGGVVEGMCEVNMENPCAWIAIYERLASIGRLEDIKRINPPKDHSTGLKPRKVVVKR